MKIDDIVGFDEKIETKTLAKSEEPETNSFKSLVTLLSASNKDVKKPKINSKNEPIAPKSFNFAPGIFAPVLSS